MKDLTIEFDKDNIEKGDALTEKKAYDVYWVDCDTNNFLIMDNNRIFIWVNFDTCKGAF